jgi:hypothetical protein
MSQIIDMLGHEKKYTKAITGLVPLSKDLNEFSKDYCWISVSANNILNSRLIYPFHHKINRICDDRFHQFLAPEVSQILPDIPSRLGE